MEEACASGHHSTVDLCANKLIRIWYSNDYPISIGTKHAAIQLNIRDNYNLCDVWWIESLCYSRDREHQEGYTRDSLYPNDCASYLFSVGFILVRYTGSQQRKDL